MAEPIKSVLLLDYESLQRSLSGSVGDARLAERSAAWLAALEAGRLGPNVKRKLVVKRCYASASVRGKQHDLLVAAGFDLVEAAESSARGSANVHMAMDAIDALGSAESYQEFILFAAGAELAPLLSRLKAGKRVTVIYADALTPASDRNLADAIVEAADFVRVLTGEPTPVAEISVPANAPTPRADIEAFARRIHAATSIPLFSPKTFAELFRQLTEEIANSGYHFQTTARNVADRMVASGRNVTRRQVVFIVKGLALKGHVFSTSDTAERLAEVFREQAHYLITNAGITLNQHEEDLLTAWFLSRPPSGATAAPAPLPSPAAPRPAAAPPEAASTTPEAPSDAKATIAETIEREVAKAVARPPQPERVAIKPPQPQAQPPRPNAAQQQKPPAVKVELPKSTARPPPFPSAREEAKAVIAARIAGAARMKPAGTRTPIPAKPAPKAPAASPAPPAEVETAPVAESPPPPSPADGAKADALENSILAAIAEAVDVLVEDSDEHQEPEPPPPPPPQREPPPRKRAGNNAAPPPRQPEPEPPAAEEDEPAESNDIGDQIQRIIASYNRNRSDE